MKIFLTNVSGGFNSVLSALSLLLIFIFVLVLAYFTSRFAAKYQNNLMNNKSNIRIVESFRLGNNRFIAIVRIGGSYYALGLGKEEITMIDKINPDELKDFEVMKTSEKKFDFKEILSQVKNKNSDDDNKIK